MPYYVIYFEKFKVLKTDNFRFQVLSFGRNLSQSMRLIPLMVVLALKLRICKLIYLSRVH